MADISDITAYFANSVASAVYPNGTSQPSVTGKDVLIYEGWPVAEQLDLDLKGQQLINGVVTARPNGPRSNVSIYSLGGGSSAPFQIFDNTYVVAQPVLGLTVSVSGNQITITGAPGTGEFVTIVADRQYIFSQTGTTAAAVLSALLTAVQVNYPSASLSGPTLTIPYNYELDVRQGGVGTLGKVTHRLYQEVQVTTWAPDPVTRTALGRAINAALTQVVTTTMPDTSMVKIAFSRTYVTDKYENQAVYQRNDIYTVEYAIVTEFPGYTVTSVQTQISVENQSPANIPQVTEVT